MKDNSARSGYDLAVKILETHPNDAIETMLRYSGGEECDWLEFKAGMTLLPEDEKKGFRPDDLYWDYVLSIVAMANTRGGAFVIGVNDKTHKEVPLSSCDPRHVLENEGKDGYFRKEVLDRIDRRDRTWTTKDGTVWSLDESIAPHLECRFVPFEGTDVLVLLVKPVDSGAELFVGQKIKNGDVFESLPFRHLGEAGKVKRLTKRAECDNYIRTREITSGQFGTWWAELDAEASAEKEDAALDAAIRAYHVKLEENTRKRLQAFVPLDAAGSDESNEDEEIEYEDPTAVPVFDEDDDTIDENAQARSSRGAGATSDGDDALDEPESDDESDEDDGDSREPQAIQMGLSELLAQYDRVILSGEPGAGKTTSLAHFAVESGKKQGDSPHLFAFIQLGRWAAGGSVLGLVAKTCGLSLSQIETLLEENRLHLILDALNECPDHLRPAALENIRVLVREHPDLPVVLSSRKVEGLGLSGFPIFEVQAMDRDRQLQFLERYLGNAGKAATVLETLEKQPGGASIAQNPMLLRMVVDVVQDAEVLPSGRATLYRRWLEKWYTREEKKARKAKVVLPWTVSEAIRLLARMAFAGRAEGYRDIPLDMARKALDDSSGIVLEKLCQGPLLEIEDDLVHFRHETFQEYLCAEWLLAEPTALDCLAKKDYDTWGMPVAYAAELRLPNKLPEELSAAVWEMNPWIAALAASASPPTVLAGDTPKAEMVLADALFRKVELRPSELCNALGKEISKGSLFQQNDAPLSYLVFCSDTYRQWWQLFECSYFLHMPSYSIQTRFDKRYRSSQGRSVKSLRNKVRHLIVLKLGTVVPTLLSRFPFVPIVYIAQRWGWFFMKQDPSYLYEALIRLSEDCPQWKYLPIEMMSILLNQTVKLTGSKGNRRIEMYSSLFGPAFIERCLDSISSSPDAWILPGVTQILRYAAKKGFAVHEAIRSFLVRIIQILEEVGVSPFRSQAASLKSLCGLLDKTDVPALLPNLSLFGRAILKRFAFNPKGASDSLYEDLPSVGNQQFHTEDLKDIIRRREIVTILLAQPLVMTVKSNDPIVLENNTIPEGIRFHCRPRLEKKLSPLLVVGSRWIVQVDVMCLGGRYRFVAKPIRRISHEEQSCGVSADSMRYNKPENNSQIVLVQTDAPRSIEKEYGSKTTNQGLISRILSFVKGKFVSAINQNSPASKINSCPVDRKVRHGAAPSAPILGPSPGETAEGCRVFRNQDLIDESGRQQIELELKKARWEMKVQFISSGRRFLLFCNPSFPDSVYCSIPYTKYQDVFEVGQTWNARVKVKQNRRKGTWGFIAVSVKPSLLNPVCPPRSNKPQPSENPVPLDTIAMRKPEQVSGLLANLPCGSLQKNPDGASDKKGSGEPMMNKSDLSNESHLSIYIDETWPGTQDHAYKDIGVIGGVVVPWEGIDEKRLPVIKTHLSNGSVARKAIQAMLARHDVFPFVFPIKWDRAVTVGGRMYFELVQHALMLLLGWMLPQRNRLTTVDVYLEHIAGFENGHDETDFINSLTQAMRLLSGGRRFVNWQIRRVEWVDKEFGYVPYGDLVCKTCVPHAEQQMLAGAVKVREWEGYLPFSKGVFPLLRDMDTASPSGFADLLIVFAKVANDTPFFRRVRKLAVERAKSDTTFRDAVFSRFEACYVQPDRDISLLNRVVQHFLEEFPSDLFKDRPRMQLLRILIAFQHANHNGDPDLVSALVSEYQSLRPRILELDRDLCAYADLNLAVHEHDAFEFVDALSLVDGWINDPLFPALSVMNRGRMFSSRGQSLALMGRNQEADEAFARALAQFAAEPELLAKDIEQTKTYQVMNALDQDASSAVPLLEGLLGKSLLVAALNSTETLDKPFVAHLFLKALWRMRTERSVVIDALLKNLPAEIAIKDQHPYELILFYLALLTKDTNPAYAHARAEELEQFFEAIEFGGALGLVHSYIRVMLKHHGFNVVADKDFFDELDIVEQYLPKARSIINKLRAGWVDPAMSVEGVLPFNYC